MAEPPGARLTHLSEQQYITSAADDNDGDLSRLIGGIIEDLRDLRLVRTVAECEPRKVVRQR